MWVVRWPIGPLRASCWHQQETVKPHIPLSVSFSRNSPLCNLEYLHFPKYICLYEFQFLCVILLGGAVGTGSCFEDNHSVHSPTLNHPSSLEVFFTSGSQLVETQFFVLVMKFSCLTNKLIKLFNWHCVVFRRGTKQHQVIGKNMSTQTRFGLKVLLTPPGESRVQCAWMSLMCSASFIRIQALQQDCSLERMF